MRPLLSALILLLSLSSSLSAETPEGQFKIAPDVQYCAGAGKPLLMAHGENDDLVPFDQSVRMTDALSPFFKRYLLAADRNR
jgi:fermentation-respiration switch protein FrsA (DUF1100 family)